MNPKLSKVNPLSPQHLERFFFSSDPSFKVLRDTVLCLTGLLTLQRAGNILLSTISDLSFFHNGERVVLITLPRTKTSDHPTTFPLTAIVGHRLCPLLIFEQYIIALQQENLFEPHLPLFPKKKGVSLTVRDYSNIIDNIAKKSGDKKKFSSRSTRSGGTTNMLSSGVPEQVVKHLGQWAPNSNVWSKYFGTYLSTSQKTTQKLCRQN